MLNSVLRSSSTRAAATIDLSGGLPTGEAKERAVRAMFDTVSPRYDLVNRIMTFGLDTRWRKRSVAMLGLPPGSRVLDIAAGTGDFCRDLATHDLVPIGMDFSWGMLEHARTDAPLVQCDALRLPVPDHAVDGVTCGFALRNFRDLPTFFHEIGRAVRPGGRIALLDASAPNQPVLRFGHRIYFGEVVPRIGGLLSDKTAYKYLPKSLAYIPDPPVVLGWLRDAGFSGAQRHTFLGGAAHLFTATRGIA
jgi:demethylmenaquinone methyltransferase / 2-methoxy-6-polyprenyl-1,4-benzoquinol methylase